MKNINFQADKLEVKLFETNDGLGQAAAESVAEILQAAIAQKGSANLILATGASQIKFLDYLQKQAIDWQKITVFHLDEYKDLPETHLASFRKYLKECILEKVNSW